MYETSNFPRHLGMRQTIDFHCHFSTEFKVSQLKHHDQVGIAQYSKSILLATPFRVKGSTVYLYFAEIDLCGGCANAVPPLPKITHPSFPHLGKSQVSTGRSAMPQSPPEGTACLITVSPVPGKLAWLSWAFAYIPRLCSKHLWVLLISDNDN